MEGTSILALLVRLMESPQHEVQANCAAAIGSLASSRTHLLLLLLLLLLA